MATGPLLNTPRCERRDAARNRAAILRAAERLLETGPDALTMSAVAERAGVGAGTIYRRFGDRDGLLGALLDERERAFQESFLQGAPPLGPGAPPAVRLEAFLRAVIERYDHEPALTMIARRRPPSTATPFAGWRLHLAMLLRESDEVADPHLRAQLLLALITPATQTDLRAQGFSTRQIADQVVAMAAGRR